MYFAATTKVLANGAKSKRKHRVTFGTITKTCYKI